ncbi:MAG: hypothetical protein N3D14_02630 [Aquificaceae bacterium]|nr:hypothetical protein [Aquificaceae bacterium]MCX8164271.1 hypothetical protein [Aquificaceae bacterium]
MPRRKKARRTIASERVLEGFRRAKILCHSNLKELSCGMAKLDRASEVILCPS